MFGLEDTFLTFTYAQWAKETSTQRRHLSANSIQIDPRNYLRRRRRSDILFHQFSIEFMYK